MKRAYAAVLGTALFVAACGNTTEDRAISGAGIGAAAGAAVGAVTGLSIVEGALIGAAAGGITGAVTDKSQVNLGDPLWKRGSGSGSASAGADTVRQIQSGLSRLGYDPGPADGRVGPRTRSAIRQYQQDNKLLVDGEPTGPLLDHIQQRI
jgi:peptidoglycan hydrolase-like protein with peptidoglycan-binding domain